MSYFLKTLKTKTKKQQQYFYVSLPERGGDKTFHPPIPILMIHNLASSIYWASISILPSLIKHDITSACTVIHPHFASECVFVFGRAP